MKEVIWECAPQSEGCYMGVKVFADGTAVYIRVSGQEARFDDRGPSGAIVRAYADLYRQLHPVLPPLPSCPEDKEWERVEVELLHVVEDDDLSFQDGKWHRVGDGCGNDFRWYALGRGWVYRLRDKHVEWPRSGDKYFFVSATGDVGCNEYAATDYDYPSDLKMIEIGNCFKTREEAEAARERVLLALGAGRPWEVL